MAKVAFSPVAQADLDKTAAYMENVLRNPGAARKFVQDMKQQIQILRDFPEMGTPFESADGEAIYRRLVCGNYVALYRLDGDTVYVDRILYGRRDYMALLFGDETAQRDDENE
ncbi:MAG: type II toxin-antitoxin system RelE/ParE family toxin [Oscillospiraceae bacterium]|nr:type II toxin-antitoxin system RelE/ParE family toxin [Oscillospiraceae bacterium]